MEQIDFSEAPLCRNHCEIQVFARWLLDRVEEGDWQVAHCTMDEKGQVVACETGGFELVEQVAKQCCATAEEKEDLGKFSSDWLLLVSLPDSVTLVTLPHGAHLTTFSIAHHDVIQSFPMRAGSDPPISVAVGDTLEAIEIAEIGDLDDMEAARRLVMESVFAKFGEFLSRPASDNPLIGVGFVEDGLLKELSVRATDDELADVEDARTRAAIKLHLRSVPTWLPSIVMVDGPKAVILDVTP